MKDISRCSYLFSLQTLDISEFLHFPLPPDSVHPWPAAPDTGPVWAPAPVS